MSGAQSQKSPPTVTVWGGPEPGAPAPAPGSVISGSRGQGDNEGGRKGGPKAVGLTGEGAVRNQLCLRTPRKPQVFGDFTPDTAPQY